MKDISLHKGETNPGRMPYITTGKCYIIHTVLAIHAAGIIPIANARYTADVVVEYQFKLYQSRGEERNGELTGSIEPEEKELVYIPGSD